jgi:hypothetical protein
MAVQELYDIDFFEWTQRNAELLRRGCLESADISNIAEELADLGKKQPTGSPQFSNTVTHAPLEMAVSASGVPVGSSA